MKILHVVGARPNFMKAAPVIAALSAEAGLRQTLVHTGQHYNESMSEVFFRQLGIPDPDVNLEVGPGSHAQQTAQVIVRFEPVVHEVRPDLMVVYGDVNSTLAAALVGAKLLIPVGHVEAGLRSHDRTMPEEINRVLTDDIASLLFTPSADGDQNLLEEGIATEGIHLVGNVMIDTLVRFLPLCRRPYLDEVPAEYALVTLHRPSNVDDLDVLGQIVQTLAEVSEEIPVLFPAHPRTRQALERVLPARRATARLRVLEPLGYLEFLSLQRRARVVITDSGGVQEETTFLRVPCLTVRENTERPVTVTMGTNVLVGRDMGRLREEVSRVLAGKGKVGKVPPLWDGRAGQRIAAVIATWADGNRVGETVACQGAIGAQQVPSEGRARA